MATREELDNLVEKIHNGGGTIELFCNPKDLLGVEFFAGLPLIRSLLVEPGSIYVFNPKGLTV